NLSHHALEHSGVSHRGPDRGNLCRAGHGVICRRAGARLESGIQHLWPCLPAPGLCRTFHHLFPCLRRGGCPACATVSKCRRPGRMARYRTAYSRIRHPPSAHLSPDRRRSNFFLGCSRPTPARILSAPGRLARPPPAGPSCGRNIRYTSLGTSRDNLKFKALKMKKGSRFQEPFLFFTIISPTDEDFDASSRRLRNPAEA